jgi:hypothetical protein
MLLLLGTKHGETFSKVVTPSTGPAPFTSRRLIMIRFVTGVLTIIAGVAAVEGTAPLATGIIIAIAGILIMLWGLGGMAERGDLDVG